MRLIFGQMLKNDYLCTIENKNNNLKDKSNETDNKRIKKS